MPPNTQASSAELGTRIRARREELNLTIEQAAAAAGVGSESWRRYEQGKSIRSDKVRGVCRALRWPSLREAAQGEAASPAQDQPSLWDMAVKSRGYSKTMAAAYGEACARTFALGCDYTIDGIKEDLRSLANMPRGTHAGELGASWMETWLPDRWLTRYDYEFGYRLLSTITTLRLRMTHPNYDGVPHLTRCPADDLALHLIFEQGAISWEIDEAGDFEEGDAEEWEYSLNGEDDEIIYALYSEEIFPPGGHKRHFERWFDQTYYGLADTQRDSTVE
ncbi:MULTISPECIES: helix-turn-helix domain-containing protein [Amycolatopsis]|uniref:Helix-turn-helix domain-containing protein n=1 Tax=Amycolatopsis albidoflavus TaxID=102226 RepID=A0ABW5IHB7_9PSEU